MLKPLGSGGMGDVFLAEDTRLKRTVALKILPVSFASQPDRLDRFEREAQTVASLSHANIVTVFSVEQAGNTHLLTMEFIDGRTLNIWTIDPDGSGLRQLTKGAWRGYPVSAPDGSRIVTDDLEAHRLFIYDARDFDKPPEQLPPNPDAAVANLLSTDWSPDGQRILCASPATPRGGVWMYTLSDRTHRRLARTEAAVFG